MSYLLPMRAFALVAWVIVFNLSAISLAGSLMDPVKKNSPTNPNQVENIPVPVPVKMPTFTEAAITLSTISPKGKSVILGSKSYNLNQVKTLPVISAQIQHWIFQDFERAQNMGFIIGTGLGDRKMSIDLNDGNLLSNVEITYLNIVAGLSWEQTLFEEQLAIGLSGIISQELWQQNAPYLESQWSQWVPAMGLIIQAKWRFNQKWYCLGEVHNRWPLKDNQIDSTNQRLHIGFGYSL